MELAERTPLSISAKTREDLTRKFLQVQASDGVQLKVIAIYFDSSLKEHVLWYYPKHTSGRVF